MSLHSEEEINFKYMLEEDNLSDNSSHFLGGNDKSTFNNSEMGNIFFMNFDDSFNPYNKNLGEYMGEKIINNNKTDNNELNKKENINNNNNITTKIEKDIKYNELNKNNDIKPNKIIKPNNNLFKVYPKKQHTKYNRDNLIDKIIRCFLNNIYPYLNEEIIKIKNRNKSLFSNNKIFEKITSIVIFFKKLNLENLLKLRAEDILYTDDIGKKFNKKEMTEKFKEKKKENNKKNKILIKNIKEHKNKIEEIKDEEIKKSILNLNEIIDKSLYDMYKIYITNDKKYANFRTLIDDMIILENNGQDKKYVERYENVAKSLLENINESN